MILKYLKLFSVVALSFVGVNAVGQDLLASQAPIDKKTRTIDSVALQRQIQFEQSLYPAYSIYPNWDNRYVHSYGNVAIPDTFLINLTGFYMPTDSRKITSKYGPRRRRMHYGLDLKVYIGDTIRAAFDGKVRIVKYERKGYGKYVVIRHENGLETVYGHLSKQLVAEDEFVRAGDVIGLGGNTGRSTGSHLHFETRFLGQAINPELLFDFPNQDVVADTWTYRKRGASHSVASKTSAAGGNDSGEIVYYKVKSGDTLSKIAKRQGTTIDQLCKLNRIKRTTVLRLGQVLRCS